MQAEYFSVCLFLLTSVESSIQFCTVKKLQFKLILILDCKLKRPNGRTCPLIGEEWQFMEMQSAPISMTEGEKS